MFDLFDTHPEISQASCDAYAEKILNQPVRPLDWQGCHSYTLESGDEQIVIQFRSAASPLDKNTVKLAKKVHPTLVPATEYLGFFESTEVTVWKMDKIPGLGIFYVMDDDDVDIKTKLPATVTNMAKFYVEAWQSRQTPSLEETLAVRQTCETKLAELEEKHSSSSPFLNHIRTCKEALDDILKLPWVLTHDDLSSMNLLFNRTTGNLVGVVDWADAEIWPFGKGLWGVESVLGFCGSEGYTWLDDDCLTYRKLFAASLQEQLCLPADILAIIEKARKLGLLLRYGYEWQDGGFVLVDDTAVLEMFLDRAMFK
ncbi:hypothetical protein QM012_002635 [Aureobasidium pullulans]|uniref:Aminoglycoside phosphotransferase domain-containing protein n=1 Tax=Aureobasidium pullulans TaxID=5580 RepID=A0ABR0TA96_AURPU